MGRRRPRQRSRLVLMKPSSPSLLFYIWLLTHTLTATKLGIGIGIGIAEAKKPIPQSRQQSFLYSTAPPWNPSPHIDRQGFLSTRYKCVPGNWEKDARIGGKYGYNSKHTKKLVAEDPDIAEVYIRQVPGDGNCLFHSLAAALSWVEDGVHLDFDEKSSNPNHTRSLINLGWGQQSSNKSRSAIMVDHIDEMERLGLDHVVSRKRKRNGRHRHRHRHLDVDESVDIYTRSAILRQLSVDMFLPSSITSAQALKSSTRRNHDHDDHNNEPTRRRRRSRRVRERPLFLQGSEFLRPRELLQVASSQYGMSGEEYCEQMRNDGVWGGGPEIVGICNWLRRPIHVYELISIIPKTKRSKPLIRIFHSSRQSMNSGQDSDDDESERGIGEDDSDDDLEPEFRLRRMACFGSPKFDDREPLHILSADCRFPDLTPGHQASAGNHFMAVFPTRKPRAYHLRERRLKRHNLAIESMKSNVRVRSGGSAVNGGDATTPKDPNTHKYRRRSNRRIKSDDVNSSQKSEKKGKLESDGTSTLISRIIDFATRRTKVKALPEKPQGMNPNPIEALKRWYCDRQGKEM